METGRGRRGKKGWHLTLGLTEVIFGAFGMVGLLMMSFILGTLAGRGDIYRAAYSLGLLIPEAKQVAQIIPPLAPAAAPTQAATPAAAATPVATPPSPAAAAAAPAAAAGKPSQPGPVTGSMIPSSPPAATASAKKRAARAAQAQEQKAREDQLLRQHQDMAKKMVFLNSIETTSKPGQKKEKDKTSAKPAPSQIPLIKVATYRDSKTAQARMAELQKQGVKAILRQGKDGKGTCYTVYRQAANPKEPEKLAQGKDKEKPGSASSSLKPKN